jgi:hypothetical protein
MPLLPTAAVLVSEEVGAFVLGAVLVFRSLGAGDGDPLVYSVIYLILPIMRPFARQTQRVA